MFKTHQKGKKEELLCFHECIVLHNNCCLEMHANESTRSKALKYSFYSNFCKQHVYMYQEHINRQYYFASSYPLELFDMHHEKNGIAPKKSRKKKETYFILRFYITLGSYQHLHDLNIAPRRRPVYWSATELYVRTKW